MYRPELFFLRGRLTGVGRERGFHNKEDSLAETVQRRGVFSERSR